MNSQFNQTENVAKKHVCELNNCGKCFRYPSDLGRHKKTTHRSTETGQSSTLKFRTLMTPNNNFFNNEQPLVDISSSASVDPVPVNLSDMVFHENDEARYRNSVDEEEDEDKLLDENVTFTEYVGNEPEAVADEIEDQTPIVANGEFFPFRDKIHQLVYQFYYRSGGDISQSLMKDIIKLLNDVTKAKVDYPEAKVPAADSIFNFDDKRRTKNQIPLLKQTEHKVKVQKTVNGQEVEQTLTFHMNPPSEVLKLLVANPSVTDHLSKLPDHTEGELVDSYQSQKWKTESLFQHPMVSIQMNSTVKDIWVGDLVEAGQMQMIVDRFYTLNHSTIMAEGYQVVTVNNTLYLHNMPEKTSVETGKISSIVCNCPETLSLNFESNVLGNPDLHAISTTIMSKITMPNPLKRPSLSPTRKFMPVKVIPLNFFTDDMSGNRTKKHNKFDSWIMVPAALPLSERHALQNTAFICTDHLLSAMQMLPAIVDDLVLLEKGVEMFLPSGEGVVVVAPLQFITADNARHSEIASSRGAISKMPCRKCVWELKTPGTVDGSDYHCAPRSEDVVAQMHAQYVASGGDKTLLVDAEAGYKLVGGQALLKLKSFDTMKDCPIELLHTIMLGVGKALVKCLLGDHLKPAEKSILESRLHGYISNGFSRRLRSSLRLHGSFLGRDYKILIQQIPILLNQLIDSGEIRPDEGIMLIKACFENLGKLASLSYVSRIKSNSNLYLRQIASTYNDLRLSVLYHNAFIKQKRPTRSGHSIYNSSKMHIMHHLVDDIYRFGSPIFYETEKGEQFNKFIRECLFRTNRHNPSKDVAVAFAKRMMAYHILSGGSWSVADIVNPVKASHKVLGSSASFGSTIRDFADNDDNEKTMKVGSTGIFKNSSNNLLIGEVAKFDSTNGVYTIIEYALWCDQGQVTRFRPSSDEDASLSVYHTCRKDRGGNLYAEKLLQTKSIIRETECQFIEMLDISRRSDHFNLINTSKFGTFWWALSHKNNL
ncbi:hypothetical protein INT47_012471 [Mucor saturninus]|uniref:C2H2-type domain-containing protein n=1 Tax=Mucor saturninus TaxID=64648 RepID=A0A8H7QGL1_9FUNG|nr:hypothetical protein INT47_012471 [Mucor saturninus]